MAEKSKPPRLADLEPVARAIVAAAFAAEKAAKKMAAPMRPKPPRLADLPPAGRAIVLALLETERAAR
jgi:hypothetical protein